jgi:hypothetical protein
VTCADPDLAERLKSRRRTVLNPVKLRRYKDRETARKWISGIAA